ncbi:hypothetical protein [Sphingomonas sp. 3-13AW]|uniref:hypothetical protein n=1 Tax=Sphingomonas sp. 3-13AW TaxID=3050450 RepID=UPI003BB7F704
MTDNRFEQGVMLLCTGIMPPCVAAIAIAGVGGYVSPFTAILFAALGAAGFFLALSEVRQAAAQRRPRVLVTKVVRVDPPRLTWGERIRLSEEGPAARRQPANVHTVDFRTPKRKAS